MELNRKQSRLILNLLALHKHKDYSLACIKKIHMEIINKNAALLSNSEVYSLLKEIELEHHNNSNQNKKTRNTKEPNIPAIISDSLKYLDNSLCKHQNEELIKNFLGKCTQFELTKIEKLQILNQRPTNAVELQLLIESSEERFTLEQMDEILAFVNQTLPIPETIEIDKQSQEEIDQEEGKP